MGAPRSPKLKSRREWYRYYAGYSEGFVADTLDLLAVPVGGTILDPWNGSGTTTAVAYAKGFSALGLDANPALVIVAKARVLDNGLLSSIQPLAKDILVHAKREGSPSQDTEPLCQWFDAGTSVRVRALETAIRRLFVGDASVGQPAATLATQMSTLAAFYYVAVFEVVRALANPFKGSNPTWVKVPTIGSASATWDDLSVAFEASLRHLSDSLPRSGVARQLPTVVVGTSTSLPFPSASIDAVLSSPPYCTRIDYVTATRPELALLGYSRPNEIKSLRDQMVGTTTMSSSLPLVENGWGPTAAEFIGDVTGHPSKASSGYYRRYYLQYFDALARSVDEIVRVAATKSSIALVVQDSYYKDIYLDLAAIVSDMMSIRERRVDRRFDFVAHSLAAINPRSRKYTRSFLATESLLVSSSAS